MLALPFQYAIPREHQNNNLLAQLHGEKSEILKLALDAYMSLRRNNYVFTGGVLGPVQTALPAAVVPLEDMMAWYVSRCCQQTGPAERKDAPVSPLPVPDDPVCTVNRR